LLPLSFLAVSAFQFGSPALVFALSFSLAVISTGLHFARSRKP
jgi:hypothetical protein